MYFLYCLVLFVSMLAKWLAGKTYSRDIFCVEGFPLQRPDWRVIYCNGLLYVFPTHNIANFLINFTFLPAAYVSKARHSLFVLKMPLNPNQSINQFFHFNNWARVVNLLHCAVLDRCSLQDAAAVERCQLLLVDCLMHLFSKKRVNDHQLFSRVVDILVRMRTESNQHVQFEEYFLNEWRNRVDFPPIFYEMWS